MRIWNSKGNFFHWRLNSRYACPEDRFGSGDQLHIDGNVIHSFYQVVDHLEKTEDNQSVAFTVRKGGENGTEKTYDLIPVEKELADGTTIITRKLIGFAPKFKTITTYPNPLTLIVRAGKRHVSHPHRIGKPKFGCQTA